MEKRNDPPTLMLQFFRWYCHPKLVNHIEGDLREVYKKRVKKIGKRRADLRFAWDIILLIRPGIIKSLKTSDRMNHTIMLRSNIRIALRSLWKNKTSTLINLVGLTVGITSCLLITLFIKQELSYDTFQSNKERIARVVMEYNFEGSTDSKKGTFTSTKVAPVFSRTFPEVEKGIRMTDANVILRLNDQLVMEEGFMYTDSSFFDTFDYEMLEGNATTALNNPYKVVLTESMAKKYFGNESPLGKILPTANDKVYFEITGVIRDYPKNSQIRFDFLASFSSMGRNQETTYFNANYTTYLLLRDEQSIFSLQEKLHPFMEKEMEGSGASIHFFLEKFEDVHLHSPYAAFVPSTSMQYLYILSGVALLIIVIVCFTYINLSTAKSIERAKEVGIRKVSGAAKSQLFWQFIGESIVLCGLSVFVSFGIASLLLPSFNLLTNQTLRFQELLTASFLIPVVGATVLVSVLAGAYPAFVLSGLQPSTVLKGVFKNTKSARWVQQSLIVFQFSIAVFLIISTLVIQRQVNFIQNKNLGYDRTHVLKIPIGWGITQDKLNTIKQELKGNPQIVAVTRGNSSPVNIQSGYSMRTPDMPDGEVISVNANPIDEDYLKVNGLQLIAGTNFTSQDMKDIDTEVWEDKKYHYILNESAARRLGWTPEEAIGQTMQLNGPGKVSGVIKDFHFQSMRNAIQPLVLFTEAQGYSVLVKMRGEHMTETITFLEKKWKELIPTRPFEYRFLEDDYNSLYQSEIQLGKMMNLFAAIAILLACLGLFGLSSYMVQQHMKEISIRKVLGASLLNLFRVLSGNFVKLVLIAFVIASPIAYWLMKQWVSDFVYHIDVNVWILLAAGVLTLSIAILTVGIHGVKAALENPVKSLKSE
jgi:putative ABC transport system permease protein